MSSFVPAVGSSEFDYDGLRPCYAGPVRRRTSRPALMPKPLPFFPGYCVLPGGHLLDADGRPVPEIDVPGFKAKRVVLVCDGKEESFAVTTLAKYARRNNRRPGIDRRHWLDPQAVPTWIATLAGSSSASAKEDRADQPTQR